MSITPPIAPVIAVAAILTAIAIPILLTKQRSTRKLRDFDGYSSPIMKSDDNISSAHDELYQYLVDRAKQPLPKNKADFLAHTRKELDTFFEDIPHQSEITPVSFNGVKGEWICSKNSDPNRRLLYLHGGGFICGSPKSHRTLTTYLAEEMGLSVLVIDYRLMPEYTRLNGIEDCQHAWQYIINNGPTGIAKPVDCFVAGDSAGGSLSLMLSAWSIQNAPTQPSGVIAFSPTTDNAMASPSLKRNIATDPMLAPILKPLQHIPQPFLALLWSWKMKISSHNPLVSPLRGELNQLPPTLIQASRDELLVDDSIRYFNKARHQGCDISLQIWPKMVHVWQIFHYKLPEAIEALNQVKAFIEKNSQP